MRWGFAGCIIDSVLGIAELNRAGTGIWKDARTRRLERLRYAWRRHSCLRVPGTFQSPVKNGLKMRRGFTLVFQFSFAFARRAGNLRAAMTPHEKPSPSGESPAPGKRAHPPRRSRRGGRGRRRPGPRPGAGSAVASPAVDETIGPEAAGAPIPADAESTAAEAPLPDSPIEEARREAAEAAVVESREYREPREDERREERARPERHERRDFKPATPAAVAEAIEEVTRIIASLRQVLDQMDEILETLELAEVQKTADEREIQSLRNALRQFDRRGPGPRQEAPGHEHRSPEPRRDRRR